MPSIAIKGSICSGHDGFPPRPSIEGQELFTVNGIPVMATGDAFALHVKPDNPPHGGTAIGSSHLTINGKKAALVGDAVSCGSTIATGEPLLTAT
ncbi:PAAR domain-containing protein (plasmid) [Photobacterium damselae subsp. damselae]